MRPRLRLVLAAVTALVLVGLVAVIVLTTTRPADRDAAAAPAWEAPQETPVPVDAPAPVNEGARPAVAWPPGNPRRVDVEIDGFLTWAALDRRTGTLVYSGDQRTTVESMIKPWIVADFLRTREEQGREPTEGELAIASAAIRNSSNNATEVLYLAAGDNAQIQRMIDICGLRDVGIVPFYWSRTEISAVDAVRLGACLADGRAAGPEWTDWVLNEMRNVQGSTAPQDQRPEDDFEGGRWGIIDGLTPEMRSKVAIKNGFTRIGATGNWHVNCLAVTDEWVLAVLMQYPAHYSLDYGAERCAAVAQQLFTPPDEGTYSIG